MLRDDYELRVVETWFRMTIAGETPSIRSIADRTGIPRSTVFDIVDRLQDRGFWRVEARERVSIESVSFVYASGQGRRDSST